MKKTAIYRVIVLVLLYNVVIAGTSNSLRFKSDNDIFGTRSFIENKGQFDKLLKGNDKVYFALLNGNERVFFTENGVVHQLVKEYPISEEQLERIKEGRKVHQKEPDIYEACMKWEGRSSEMKIEGSERQSNYFTFGTSNYNSYTFKKITYKNVYKNIDFEYVIPVDKSQGIKYNVILHPGANSEDIKMVYSGDVKKIKTDKAGNVIIRTPLDDIIEYAPKSYYSDKTNIKSAFKIAENTLMFEFIEPIRSNQTIIIDPWVTTISTLANCNYGYDVDYDNNGNVFIYGGNPPCKLAKYNAAGVLLWTFSGTIINPSWVSSTAGYAGNFVVIKTNGKCYLGQPINVNGTQIVRLDAAGNYDNLISPGVPSWREVWDMAYHCSTGNVYGMGGSTQSNQSAGVLNQLTGTLTPVGFFTVANASSSHDIVNHAIDDTGEFFWIYGSGYPSINNRIARINSSFTSSVWIVPSTFTVMQEAANHSYAAGAAGGNGFNCLAVNQNYLFYYDGFNIAAYNKANGSIVASTSVTGQLPKKQGGIAVDDCNNLYLGSNGNILSYNFNGTGFTPLPSIPIGANTPTQSVYDIKLDRFSKTLYVTGSGFVSSYVASNSNSCNPLFIVCYNPLPQDYVICAGTSLTITAFNYFNFNNPMYSLQPGNITSNNGTFVVTPMSNVVYTAYVVGTNTNAGQATFSTITNVTVNPQPNAAPTTTQTTCTSTVNSFNLGVSFTPSGSTPGYTVNWSSIPNGITSNTQTALSGSPNPISPGGYTATIITSAGCSTVVSFTINPQPGPPNFTISPPGGVHVINCYQPTLNLNLFPSTNNYTWTNGISAPIVGLNAAFTSTNSFGTWTCHAINPASGCISSKTFAITQNTALPLSNITPTFQNITCSLTSVIPVVGITTPSVNVQQQWLSPLGGSLIVSNPSYTFTPGGPGTYTHVAINTANGCKIQKTFLVTSSSGFPTFSVVSQQNFTLGCGTKSVANISINNAQSTPPGSPISYTLLGPPTSPTVPVGGTLGAASAYTVNIPGTWTVITRDDGNFCDSRVVLTVLQNTIAPDIGINALTRVLTCDIPTITLESITSNTFTDFNWNFSTQSGTATVTGSTLVVAANTLAPTNTLTGTYTLIITDLNNACRSNSVITIAQNLFPPNAIISSIKQITCNTPTVLLTNSSTTGIPPVFTPTSAPIGFLWIGPSPQLPLELSSTYLGSVPGTYTMIVKDMNNGCTAMAVRTIDDGREYPVVNNPKAPDPFVIDCGSDKVLIQPIVALSTGLTYSWIPPNGAQVSSFTAAAINAYALGQYMVLVTNPISGCESVGFVDVKQGSLKGNFEADHVYGFAPLEVKFTNLSSTTTNTLDITSYWSFGNGITQITKSASVTPVILYQQAGTYKVRMISSKGDCLDSTTKYIHVELPSLLEIPNIFTPNGDGVNDLFFVKATNLVEIKMVILDRWGNKVYELQTDKGNVAWDGKNQFGKDLPDGVYYYTFKASGKDEQKYDRKGTITLAR